MCVEVESSVSIFFATFDGTATGIFVLYHFVVLYMHITVYHDYYPINIVLTFTNTTTKCVAIKLLNDDKVEGNEEFTVAARDLQDIQKTATIIIVDANSNCEFMYSTILL